MVGLRSEDRFLFARVLREESLLDCVFVGAALPRLKLVLDKT
jgi:hypothetical protein